ncbi:MAG: hypothetical protein ACQES0_08450 [Bacteroidota bacterium]
MDKLRTIYRLRALRGGILMALLNILWGSGLLFLLRLFPDLISAKIKENIAIAGNLTHPEFIQTLIDKSAIGTDLFVHAALEPMVLGIMVLVLMFLLIRLNGNTQLRITISWLLGIGLVLYAISLFIRAMTYIGTASAGEAQSHCLWLMLPGTILLATGILLTIIKSVKDLTEPIGVD